MARHDAPPAVAITATCPLCQSPLRRRRNRRTKEIFWGCSVWPRCKFSCDEPALSEAAVGLLQRMLARRDEDAPVSAADLRRLIFQWHPDRCQGPLDPGEVTTALNGLLDRLRGAA